MTGLVVFGMITGCEPTDENLNLQDAELETIKQESLNLNKLQENSLPDYFVAQLENYENVPLNTYVVAFTGREVKGIGDNLTTTFNYRVSGTGLTPQLDSFTLELPNCAGVLVSWLPLQPTSNSPNSIKWNNSVSKDGSQEYSLTFAGDIPLGIINSTVTRGSNVVTEKVLGPCKDVFTLSGSIFIDADADGIKQNEESGIPFISVDLFDGNNVKVGTVPTLYDGSFSFMVLKGSYSISVGEDLLKDANYTAVGETFIPFSEVNEDLSDINFGYLVNSDKIIRDLENKVLRVNTEPTKFWVAAIRNAGKRTSPYSVQEIRNLLLKIEGLLLEEPFQFGTNKEAEAVSILSKPIKTPLDEYLQQLLTAELNVVSGKGALLSSGEQNDAFNQALLIYAEAVACRESGNCPNANTISAMNLETKAIRSNDTRLLTSFNGSGGI